jgi:hypothetical protein
VLLRRQLQIADDRVLAVAVGYGDLRKGFDLFLQVWRAVTRRSRRVVMLWVGDVDPYMRANLDAEIVAAEADGRLKLLGWRDDVGALLSAADVFLLPSREDPFPTVVLEALSAGLPVVAFAGSGGAAELLQDEPHCHLAAMADCDGMARHVAAVARAGAAVTPERRRRARRAAARFRFGDYADQLLRLVQPDLLRISVVVPSYNYARYLPARLASIFTQTYPVLEIIVLDDGSSDDSVAVAREAAAQWGRQVQVVAQRANGGCVTRQWQRAVELARGDYIWIAEADDVAEPGFLATLAACIGDAGNAVLAFCDSRPVDGQDRPVGAGYRDYYAETAGPGALAQDDVFDAAGFARRFLSERNLILNVSAVLWQRAALRDAMQRCAGDLANWRVAGDWRIYLEVLLGGGGRVAYSAATLNLHRRHEASVTGRIGNSAHLDEVSRVHALVRHRLGEDPALAARQNIYLEKLSEQFGEAVSVRRCDMATDGGASSRQSGGLESYQRP